MRLVVVTLSLVCVAVLACPGAPEDAGFDEPLPQAWTTLCAGLAPGTCLSDGPLICTEQGPPRAACEVCGCPGGDACVVTDGDDGVCASRTVREATRNDAMISDGLGDDVYTALWAVLDDTTRPRLTLAEWLAQAHRAATSDGRQRVVVVGHEPGDRAALVLDALDDDALRLVVGDGDDAPCGGRAAAAGALSIPSTSDPAEPVELVLDVGAVDDAHSGLCQFPGSVPRCVLPHRASCLARGGALPQTVVVVDDDVFLARLDDALLRSVARVGRDVWQERLDAVIATFTELSLSHRAEPRFVVDNGGDDEVRIVEVPGDEARLDGSVGTLALAWLPRFGARPVRAIAFRALWLHAPTRAFLIAHDIVPADCDFAPGREDVVDVLCTGSDGAVVAATVDAAAAALIDVDTTE
jgi:hypothetical protein